MKIGDRVRVLSIADVARRYYGRKGIIKKVEIGKRKYYGLKIYDRKSLLFVLEGEIEK